MANVHLNEARIEIVLTKLLAHEAQRVTDAKNAIVTGEFPLKLYYAWHPKNEEATLRKFYKGWTQWQDHMPVMYNVDKTYFHETIHFAHDMPIAHMHVNGYNNIADLDKSLVAEFIVLYNKWAEAQREFNDKKTKHEAMMKKYKTVNAIYKVWPSILDFCDEKMLKQFNTPVERKTKEQLAEMNDEFLNTVATARILKDIHK